MAYSKPTELLSDLDSHGIYNAAMLEECEFDTSSVPTQSVAEVQRRIEARGLGGHVEGGPDDRLITGHDVATALAREFLGDSPGTFYQGRGSSFRADFEALEKAGH
jgi:hypothetical protein